MTVQHRSETFEFVAVQGAGDGPHGFLTVDAGVGDMLAKVAPLPGGGQRGAQGLEGAVGGTGLVDARGGEPRRDPRMADGVEPEPAEMRPQAVAPEM